MYDYNSEYFIENDIEVSHLEAIDEVKKHYIEIEDFYAEFGKHDLYNGGAILSWLGY